MHRHTKAETPATVNRRARRRPRATVAVLAVAVAAAIPLTVWALPNSDRAADNEPADGQRPATEPEPRAVASPTPAVSPTPSPHSRASGSAPGRGEVTVGLVAGSDAQESVAGERADAILLGLVPADADVAPALLSLPRDLWVDNPCTGGRTRLNAGLAGCGDVSGGELLAQMVAEVVGVDIDHRVVVDFAGFTDIVEAAGGVQVCVERPTRQRNLGLSLPAGCSTVDGAAALAWLRSRHTEQRVDGEWRPAGTDDLDRTRRQRQLIVSLLAAVADVDDPARLPRMLSALRRHADSDDAGWSFAHQLASRARGEAGEMVTLEPRVEPHTTAGGAQVLELAEPVRQLIRREHPALADRLW